MSSSPCSQPTKPRVRFDGGHSSVWWGADGTAERPTFKRYLNALRDFGRQVPGTWWGWIDAGHTDEARKELLEIIPNTSEIAGVITPKPLTLIQNVLDIGCDENSIILDSFAGSGTTAHAVLAANARDGGTRRCILVEQESYADSLTAERLRRVIQGYRFAGTLREEIMRETVTFRTLAKAPDLLERISAVEAEHGGRFDSIEKKVKDGVLTLTGLRKVEERTEGLPGEFTYCTLGPAIDYDALFAGGAMPGWHDLGRWLFHTATGVALDPAAVDEAAGRLGTGGGWSAHLLYRPDRDWLESEAAALTLSWARALGPPPNGQRHLVFAAISHCPIRVLEPMGITFAPLPFELFRVQQSPPA